MNVFVVIKRLNTGHSRQRNNKGSSAVQQENKKTSGFYYQEAD
jgi:hypothetical protein